MKLIGYDPFVSADVARNFGVETVPLEQLLEKPTLSPSTYR